jgi:hypothetical protein
MSRSFAGKTWKWQHFDPASGISGGYQFVAHELAGRQEQVHAAFISSQPFVQVGLGSKHGSNDYLAGHRRGQGRCPEPLTVATGVEESSSPRGSGNLL